MIIRAVFTQINTNHLQVPHSYVSHKQFISRILFYRMFANIIIQFVVGFLITFGFKPSLKYRELLHKSCIDVCTYVLQYAFVLIVFVIYFRKFKIESFETCTLLVILFYTRAFHMKQNIILFYA